MEVSSSKAAYTIIGGLTGLWLPRALSNGTRSSLNILVLGPRSNPSTNPNVQTFPGTSPFLARTLTGHIKFSHNPNPRTEYTRSAPGVKGGNVINFGG
jgi:hypothetical protein